MIKILAIGDPHFHIENIKEIDMFIEHFISHIKSNKYSYIVILGDVLHTHEKINAMAMNKAYEFIARIRDACDASLIILVGNHDMYSNQEYLNENHWMNGLKGWDRVTIVDHVVEIIDDGMKFLFCPYVYPGRFYDALNTVKSWKEAKCIFAHQEMKGCKIGHINSIIGDEWDDAYPHIVSGHIHLNHTVSKNIYYPGSLIQHSFGDVEKNIIAELIFEKDKPDYLLKEIDLNLPKKKIIHVSVDELIKYTNTQTRDKIKLSVSGNHEEFKTFKKSKKFLELSSTVKIVFKPDKTHLKNVTDDNVCDTSFLSILYGLVKKSDNKNLAFAYKTLVDMNYQ